MRGMSQFRLEKRRQSANSAMSRVSAMGGAPFVVGRPDEVIQMLVAYRDRQLTHLSLNLHQPGQDSASVRRSMRLFARELMPILKAW